MSESLRHRGPDGFGYLAYQPPEGWRLWHNQLAQDLPGPPATVGLAQRRLSIIDLSQASLQPMVENTGTCCLVYNGEVYNYRELRQELTALGQTFHTTGDSEVILKAYLAWGEDFLPRLSGMWALAILDQRRRRLILARDRFGIKPLYYRLVGQTLYFASEIKALLAVGGEMPSPNPRAAARYLLAGLIDASAETFFQGVYAFPAAHQASIDFDQTPPEVSPRRYWDLSVPDFAGAERDASMRFRELFLDSVRLHLRSDVPVGTCLSGGLDSSAIVCATAFLQGQEPSGTYAHLAFGYRSSDSPYDEIAYMKAAALAAGVTLHEITVSTEQVSQDIGRVLQAHDEPVGSASVAAQWYVFQRARAEGITVMLDGQGADETLAGYHGYFATLATSFLRRGKLGPFARLYRDYKKLHGAFPVSWTALAGLLVVGLLPGQNGLIRRQALLSTPLARQLTPELANSSNLRPLARDDRLDPADLTQKLSLDIESLVLPSLLRYEDRNSMAHSLEARVPFLDHRLVEFVFSLPDEYKIRGLLTKNVMREGLRDLLPPQILERKDKIGFKPSRHLTLDLVRLGGKELWDEQGEFERRWLRPGGLEALYRADDGSVSAEFALWRLLNLKLWLRRHWG
jgi:asparagine synthase (glutamine-hydrolysing)